jgi:hypothetical protein
MNAMDVVKYIRENHFEHEFNVFRNSHEKEPLEVSLLRFYDEKTMEREIV